jgi:hypothetical protein
MRIEFTVFAPGFSINSAYYLKSFKGKSPSKIRTRECRDWGDDILIQIQKMKQEFEEFKESFDDKIHAVEIDLTFYIPGSKFYTKAGHISIASLDLTNVEKLLVDLIFDSRFHGRELLGHSIVNLNLDDKLIVSMTSKKRPSKKSYKIKIEISRVSNQFVLEDC